MLTITNIQLYIVIFCFILFPAFFPLKVLLAADINSFGLAGDCSMAKNLGAKWSQNWGHGTYFSNQGTYECIDQGIQTFFTIGKFDNNPGAGTFRSNPAGFEQYNIPALEATYLKDDTDHALYNEIVTLASTVPGVSDARLDSIRSSFLLLEKYIQDYPGSVFAIANEPDYLPVMDPTNYAKYYHDFYTQIKRKDTKGTAKVMVGGITLFDHGWDATLGKWKYDFIAAYQNLYGSKPPVDIWGVHSYYYGRAPEGPQNVDASVATQFVPYLSSRVAEFQQFLTSNGYTSPRIWLTEFGVWKREGAYTVPYESQYLDPNGYPGCMSHGCLNPEQQEREYQIVVDIMTNLINWLTSPGSGVEKWFWMSAGENRFWDPYNFMGNIYRYNDGTGEYNPLGITYMQLVPNWNNLVNKGFEASFYAPTSRAYGYTFWDGTASVDSNYRIVTDVIHTGKNAIALRVGSTPSSLGSVASISQTLTTNYYNGKYIKFDVYCKTEPSATAFLQVRSINAANQITILNNNPNTQYPCSDWTNIQSNWVLVPTSTVKIELLSGATGANKSVWFDDVNLQFSPTNPNPSIPGDLNSDGKITILDYRSFRSSPTSLFNLTKIIKNYGL